MNNNDQRILDLIAERLENVGIYSEPAEYGGEAALELIFDSEDEFAPKECTVTVIHPKDDMTVIQLLVTMLHTEDEETVDKLCSLLPELNSLLSIGSFGVMRSDGYMYYNYAFLTEPLDEGSMLESFGAALQVVSATAIRCGELLSGFMSEKDGADEGRHDDYSIVQF